MEKGYHADLNERTEKVQAKIRAGGDEALSAQSELGKIQNEANENLMGEASLELKDREERENVISELTEKYGWEKSGEKSESLSKLLKYGGEEAKILGNRWSAAYNRFFNDSGGNKNFVDNFKLKTPEARQYEREHYNQAFNSFNLSNYDCKFLYNRFMNQLTMEELKLLEKIAEIKDVFFEGHVGEDCRLRIDLSTPKYETSAD